MEDLDPGGLGRESKVLRRRQLTQEDDIGFDGCFRKGDPEIGGDVLEGVPPNDLIRRQEFANRVPDGRGQDALS